MELIHAYRVRGHLMADTDPLEFELRRHPDLDIAEPRPDPVGPRPRVRDRGFGTAFGEAKALMKLRDILGVLRDSYCRTIGIEYMHIQDPGAARAGSSSTSSARTTSPTRRSSCASWAAQRGGGVRDLPADQVRRAEAVLPRGRRVRDPDARRDRAEARRTTGLDEVVIGMPHRGRLNVLANIVGKSYGQIFREFEGNLDPKTAHGSGDVKYHLGADGTFTAIDGEAVQVSWPPTPRTSRPSTRSSRASCGPSRTSSTSGEAGLHGAARC